MEAEELRKSIDDLCNTKERAVLQSLGLKELSSTSTSGESGCENDSKGASPPYNLPPEDLCKLCRESGCNWFELIDQLTQVGTPETFQVCSSIYYTLCKLFERLD